jgi:hypothetical protein
MPLLSVFMKTIAFRKKQKDLIYTKVEMRAKFRQLAGSELLEGVVVGRGETRTQTKSQKRSSTFPEGDPEC